jgi:hypothetical protein
MEKLFTVAGVSKNKGAYKVRFANDLVSRIKILSKSDQDIQLIELPQGMDKPAVVSYLKAHELYVNPAYKEAIDNADAKYNPTVKVKAPKAKKAEPNMEDLKARASTKAEDATA